MQLFDGDEPLNWMGDVVRWVLRHFSYVRNVENMKDVFFDQLQMSEEANHQLNGQISELVGVKRLHILEMKRRKQIAISHGAPREEFQNWEKKAAAFDPQINRDKLKDPTGINLDLSTLH